MAASLQTLPIELVGHVTTFMSLGDLLALRLVNHELCTKAAVSKRFQSCFAMRTTDMSTKSLEALAAITAHAELGRLVQNITVMTSFFDGSDLKHTLDTGKKRTSERRGAICTQTEEDCDEEEMVSVRRLYEQYQERNAERVRMRSDGRDLELLASIFGNLGSLSTLSLEAGVYRGKEERLPAFATRKVPLNGENDKTRFWAQASHDFSVVLSAMARTKISVEEMHMYGREYGCSVLSGEIAKIMDTIPKPALKVALSGLRVLSINISLGVLEALGIRREDQREGISADGEGFASGFGQFLESAKGLEKLDVLHYKSYGTNDEEYWAFFRRIASSIVGEKLRSLRLRGFRVRAADFLSLLRRYDELQELELHEITLGDGKWSEVFNLMRGRAAKLQRLTMYRCYEEHLISITRPKDAEVAEEKTAYRSQYARTYQMDGRQVREGVEYKVNTTRWKGSGSLYYYGQKTQQDYRFF